MKKHTLYKVSTISVLCVFCAIAANAAGSVRALGGSGTISGTTAAATRGGTATRAGSLRVSPSTTRSVSTATRTNADGSTTSTERLSIGKYLGGATSVSTSNTSSSSSGSGASASAAEIAEINTNINNLYNTTQVIEQDITSLETGKQDALVSTDYIEVDGNEVSLNLTNLETYLTTSLHLPHGNVKYDNGSGWLQWTADNGATWTNLLDINGLSGDYIDATELENTIDAELANYYTKTEVDTAIQAVQEAVDAITVPEQMQSDWTQTDDTKADFIKHKPDLSVYATAENVYTKTEADDLLDAKANAADVYAKTETYSKTEADALLGAKADANIIGGSFDSEHTVAAAISALPTDVNLEEANDKITALETAVGDDSAGLIKDVADLQTAVSNIPPQVQSNWTQTDEDEVDFIKNKPTMSDYALAADVSDLSDEVDGLADDIDALDLQINGDPTDDDVNGIVGDIATLQGSVGHNAEVVAEQLAAINTTLNSKANTADVYTKTDADDLLDAKANTADVYAKTDTYSKEQADALLDAKADLTDIVQSDWDQTDTGAPDFIKHKPTIPEGAVVDAQLSTTSTNAVQNKVVTGALGEKVPAGHVPPSGQYVLGFVDGVQTYIPIVDATGNSGPAIAAATGEEI